MSVSVAPWKLQLATAMVDILDDLARNGELIFADNLGRPLISVSRPAGQGVTVTFPDSQLSEIGQGGSIGPDSDRPLGYLGRDSDGRRGHLGRDSDERLG